MFFIGQQGNKWESPDSQLEMTPDPYIYLPALASLWLGASPCCYLWKDGFMKTRYWKVSRTQPHSAGPEHRAAEERDTAWGNVSWSFSVCLFSREGYWKPSAGLVRHYTGDATKGSLFVFSIHCCVLRIVRGFRYFVLLSECINTVKSSVYGLYNRAVGTSMNNADLLTQFWPSLWWWECVEFTASLSKQITHLPSSISLSLSLSSCVY